MLPYVCPECKEKVGPADTVCGMCGAALRLACPYCGEDTFRCGNCERCKASLFIKCDCGFFQLITPDRRCRRCGAPYPYLRLCRFPPP